ncbi:MAG: acyltransferase [Verrucomicrobia bacterium]|nr:acyltransferase [Verrucomicrobiota bacterium]
MVAHAPGPGRHRLLFRRVNLLFRLLSRLRRELDAWETRRLLALCRSCGQRVVLERPYSIYSPEQLTLGDDVIINAFCQIFAGAGVTIGDGTLISSHCAISSVTHPLQHPARKGVLYSPDPAESLHRPVVLGRNVWLGMGVIVLPGVTVGDHAVLGAGAVVTADVPARAVVTGVPARVQRLLEIPASSSL